MEQPRWFTPICNETFYRILKKFPKRIRANARCFILEALLRAARSTDQCPVTKLSRGQFYYGEDETSVEVALTYRQIRSIVQACKRVGFMTVQASNKGSVGTIINFDSYVIDGNGSVEQGVGQDDELSVEQDDENAAGKRRVSGDKLKLKYKVESKEELVHTHENEFEEGSEETPSGSNGPSKKEVLVSESEHCPFLIELGAWFYGHDHVVQVKQDSAQWWDSLNTCRIILEKQMVHVPAPDLEKDPMRRLRRLLEFAVADDPVGRDFGWKPQIRSLAALSAKGKNGLPKWANVEVSAVKSLPHRPVIKRTECTNDLTPGVPAPPEIKDLLRRWKEDREKQQVENVA